MPSKACALKRYNNPPLGVGVHKVVCCDVAPLQCKHGRGPSGGTLYIKTPGHAHPRLRCMCAAGAEGEWLPVPFKVHMEKNFPGAAVAAAAFCINLSFEMKEIPTSTAYEDCTLDLQTLMAFSQAKM